MGRIFTFYSYKAGAGRSMAVANTAWVLAWSGQRVLVIDWDLEAPGVHRYFSPFLADPELIQTEGLIDYFIQAGADAAAGGVERRSLLQYAVSPRFTFPRAGTLDLVPAGQQSVTYPVRVNGFNWPNFCESLDGYSTIESMKAELQREYDYILIDSRGGVSDYSNICTYWMPDTVVACFTLNWQSMNGTATAMEALPRQPVAHRILPVPMRVEYAEKQILEEARAAARSRFAKLMPPDLDASYWGAVEVPYIPFYTYQEIPAAFFDEPHTSISILQPASNLATYLTGTAVQNWDLPEPMREGIRMAYANVRFRN
jgi:cellulose biosynthesis protein BcsQ